ncbi:MAG: ribonuclease activity regulator RraA [Nitrolancea sp.]
MQVRPTGYLSAAAKQALLEVSTATLTSQLLKRGFRNTFLGGLIPLRPDVRMVGYAFTLRYVPMREDLDLEVDYDNLTNVQRVAVEAVGQDDVLVIDARGETGSASLGNILATRIKMCGGAGIVTDGALRDANAFREIDISTYTRGVHATTSSTKHHPADMNLPVGCGGVLIMPGDVMVGDADGVVAIPRLVAEDVALGALEQERLEAFVLGKIRGGASIIGVYPPDDKMRAEYEAERGK